MGYQNQQYSLAERVKIRLIRRLNVQLPATGITDDMIQFINKNLKSYKGDTSLNLCIKDDNNDMQIEMLTNEGFEMNNELIQYIAGQPDWNVRIECNEKITKIIILQMVNYYFTSNIA